MLSVFFVAKITIRIFYLVVLIVARELVERERLNLERRNIELHAPRHILKPERDADFADRRRAEVGCQFQRRPVEVAPCGRLAATFPRRTPGRSSGT